MELSTTCYTVRDMLQYHMLYCNLKQLYLYLISYSHTVSPYHPDSHFSMNALDRLEATGIKIVTSLYGLHTKLVDILGVDKSWSVSYVINKWMSGRSHRPSTWRTLLDILKKLDLVELSQQIEDYLSGGE